MRNIKEIIDDLVFELTMLPVGEDVAIQAQRASQKKQIQIKLLNAAVMLQTGRVVMGYITNATVQKLKQLIDVIDGEDKTLDSLLHQVQQEALNALPGRHEGVVPPKFRKRFIIPIKKLDKTVTEMEQCACEDTYSACKKQVETAVLSLVDGIKSKNYHLRGFLADDVWIIHKLSASELLQSKIAQKNINFILSSLLGGDERRRYFEEN